MCYDLLRFSLCSEICARLFRHSLLDSCCHILPTPPRMFQDLVFSFFYYIFIHLFYSFSTRRDQSVSLSAQESNTTPLLLLYSISPEAKYFCGRIQGTNAHLFSIPVDHFRVTYKTLNKTNTSHDHTHTYISESSIPQNNTSSKLSSIPL